MKEETLVDFMYHEVQLRLVRDELKRGFEPPIPHLNRIRSKIGEDLKRGRSIRFCAIRMALIDGIKIKSC